MMDVLPTLLELAGIQHPAPEFRGKQVLAPRGKSWVPYFSNTSKEVHDENAIHGWELVRLPSLLPHLSYEKKKNASSFSTDATCCPFSQQFGQQAIRRGDWKALFLPLPAGTGQWTLYDLSVDPGET